MVYVFRNSMIELFFDKNNYVLSDYDSPLCNINADQFLWMNFIRPSPFKSEILNQINELKNNLEVALTSSGNKPIFILGLFKPDLSLSINLNDMDIQIEINNFNKYIISLSIESELIHFLDPDDFKKTIGKDYFSSKFYFSSSSVIAPSIVKNFKLWLEALETIIYNRRKKLLILDLDNTLWGGVIGEDGYDGIQIGNTYPGNVFLFMQKKIKELLNTGVILSICSKNNIEDIEAGFNKNKNMILKLEDFSCIKANWDDKSLNIEKIIAEINIGEDACLFIDDNPLERDMVKLNFKNLIVPDFPEKIYDIPSFIDKICFKYFPTALLTEEDNNKKLQYEIRAKAKQEESKASTKHDFLKGLNLKGLVHLDSSNYISRISQMTQKTNQFNLTTKRFDEAGINNFLNTQSYIFPLKVHDKYGDHGITALCMVKLSEENDSSAEISNFLMSCRILGREIEYDFLNWCLNFLYNKGVKEVCANFSLTKKNDQVSSFYENAGFDITSTTSNEKTYQLDLSQWIKSYDKKEKYIKINKA